MNFFGDYHTHTIFSRKPYVFLHHAKGSLEENICSAKQMGLKELAITDHGFSHKFFGCNRKKSKETKSEILRLAQKYDIKVYFGVEANFLSLDGTIDVTAEDRKTLDIVLCGFHSSAKPKTIKDKFLLFCSNFFGKFFKSSAKLVERNTTMVLNALEKNKIDVLTHLNSKMKCDVKRIAIKAKEKGTFIELNEKHCDFSAQEINELIDSGVGLIVNSDAHNPNKIGKFEKIESIIEKYNIPKDRIVNLGQTPKFLSLNTKGE